MSLFVNPNPNSGNQGGGGGSNIELSDAVDSSSTTTAASSLAVKTVNGKVDGKADIIHNHNDIYYKKSEADANLNSAVTALQDAAYKLKIEESDTPGYLSNKVDNVTLTIEGNELKVKGIDDLRISAAQITEFLMGVDRNIQAQINELRFLLSAVASGMDYRGKVETFADLQGMGNKKNGDFAVVLDDESRGEKRSIYVYNENLGMWDYISSSFEFKEKFSALVDTPSSYAGHDRKILRVNEAGESIVFDIISYDELLNKPNSTVTQIDDTVAKKHDHANKSVLDSVSESADGVFTYKGEEYIRKSDLTTAPVEKQWLVAVRTGSAQSLASGTICILNKKEGGNIPYNTSSGLFTLEKGKTYRIQLSASVTTTGWVKLGLYDVNNAQVTESNGLWTNINATSWNEASAGPLVVYVTPGATLTYKIKVVNMNGTASLRALFTTLDIQEIS